MNNFSSVEPFAHFHLVDNPDCPRNAPGNQTICTCNTKLGVDNHGMGLPVEPPDPRERTPHQQHIDEFMRKAGQEVPDSPTMPSEEVRLLRAKLIWEEVLETIEALGVDFTFGNGWMFENQGKYGLPKMSKPSWGARGQFNLKEVADGCADISVVTIGTLSACGIADARLLEEVDRSNLSKFDLPKCPTHPNHEMYLLNNSDGLYRCDCNEPGKNVCVYTSLGPYRSAEGKWVKGPQYSPADIAGVLEKQMPPKTEEITDELSVARAMLTDSASFLSEIGLAAFAYAVLQVKKDLKDVQFTRAYSPPHGTVRKLAPNPLCGAPVDLTMLHPPEAMARQRAADDGPRYDSGGIMLCPHCKCPLSDELVRKLKKGIMAEGSCPQCRGTYDLSQLELANAK